MKTTDPEVFDQQGGKEHYTSYSLSLRIIDNFTIPDCTNLGMARFEEY